jgi:F0F1-type ATP synthase delta subunit
MAHSTSHKLPTAVITPMDLSRLLREIEAIDEGLLQLKIRGDKDPTRFPKASPLMDTLLAVNDLNLLHEDDRKELTEFLHVITEKAPVVHMSFSADPRQAFLEKLVSWFRKEINPVTLISVGLQPNLGAGCILRTTNQYFDLSLKQAFADKRDLFVSELTDVRTPAESSSAPAVEPVSQSEGVPA